MFYQIFFSPQVKQIVIISNKHSMYKLNHELLKDLRLKNHQAFSSINKALISQKIEEIKKNCTFPKLFSTVSDQIY